jgi:hypothetical protein
VTVEKRTCIVNGCDETLDSKSAFGKCRRCYMRAYRAANAEKLEQQRRAYVAANRDRKAQWGRDYYTRNKAEILKRQRARKYGLSADEFEAMLATQGGCCAICGSDSAGRKDHEALSVDHCHATGKVRGLLCSKCNTAIGLLNDDPRALLNAAAYLENFTGAAE